MMLLVLNNWALYCSVTVSIYMQLLHQQQFVTISTTITVCVDLEMDSVLSCSKTMLLLLKCPWQLKVDYVSGQPES